MSAPMTKSQMAFELPRLSYIDTSWEEPVVQPETEPKREHGFAVWVADGMTAFRRWRDNARALGELQHMSERELCDAGLTRGDVDRVFDNRFNQDLLARGRGF